MNTAPRISCLSCSKVGIACLSLVIALFALLMSMTSLMSLSFFSVNAINGEAIGRTFGIFNDVYFLQLSDLFGDLLLQMVWYSTIRLSNRGNTYIVV